MFPYHTQKFFSKSCSQEMEVSSTFNQCIGLKLLTDSVYSKDFRITISEFHSVVFVSLELELHSRFHIIRFSLHENWCQRDLHIGNTRGHLLSKYLCVSDDYEGRRDSVVISCIIDILSIVLFMSLELCYCVYLLVILYYNFTKSK